VNDRVHAATAAASRAGADRLALLGLRSARPLLPARSGQSARRAGRLQ
jgi:hypothetical protein